MNRLVFSGESAVFIQGPRVLRLLRQDSESALFEVIGFENVVKIIDHRVDSLLALNTATMTGNVEDYFRVFNRPARLNVEEENSSTILISLTETDVQAPEYMLWIVNGLDGSIPVYDYVIQSHSFVDNKVNGLVALYRRPKSVYSSSKSPSSLSQPLNHSFSLINEVLASSEAY